MDRAIYNNKDKDMLSNSNSQGITRISKVTMKTMFINNNSKTIIMDKEKSIEKGEINQEINKEETIIIKTIKIKDKVKDKKKIEEKGEKEEKEEEIEEKEDNIKKNNTNNKEKHKTILVNNKQKKLNLWFNLLHHHLHLPNLNLNPLNSLSVK